MTEKKIWHGTTILSVRKGGMVVIVGDGQVSLGETVIKSNAKKVRRLGNGDVIAGFAGATAPYGYRTDGRGSLEIVETEAEVVRIIFGMRAAGHTLKCIADHFNAKRRPTRRSGVWHPGTIRYILDNPKYRGIVEYFFRWQGEGTPVIQAGQHESLLD